MKVITFMMMFMILAPHADSRTQDVALQEMSLPQLISRLLHGNAQLHSGKHHLRSLDYQAQQKRLEKDWTGWDLSLRGTYYPDGLGDEIVGFEKRVGLNLNVPLFGSQREREIALKKAEADYFLFEGELDEQQREQLLSLVHHYAVYSRGMQTKAAIHQTEDLLKQKLEILQARITLSESIPIELLATRRDLEELHLDSQKNQEAMQLALNGLRMAVGDMNLPAFKPTPIAWKEIQTKDTHGLEQWELRAIASSKAVKAIRKKIKLLQDQVDASTGMFPRSSLSVGYINQWDGSDFESGPALSIQFNLPLGFSGIRNSRKQSIAQEKLRYESDLAKKIQEIVSTVRQRYQALHSQKSEQQYSQAKLDFAVEQERIARLQEEEIPEMEGRSHVLERLDAQVEYFNALRRSQSAEIEAGAAYLKLFLTFSDVKSFAQIIGMPASPRANLHLWIGDEVLYLSEQQKKLFQYCEVLNVGRLYLSISENSHQDLFQDKPNLLAEFLRRCHEKNLLVNYFMGIDPVQPTNPQAWMDQNLKYLAVYQSTREKIELFDALHLSLGGAATTHWKENAEWTQQPIRDYVVFLEKLQQFSMPIVVDISPEYKYLPLGNSNLLWQLMKYADEIVIQRNSNYVDGTKNDFEQEFHLANLLGKKVRVAISLPESQQKTSFDLGKFFQQLNWQASAWQNQKSFAGFAIYHMNPLERLAGLQAKKIK